MHLPIELKYFDLHEFDCPTLPNSGINMDQTFLRMLDEARGIADVAFIINSGYRSEEHNSAVGGSANSSHLRGYACDISCKKGIDRERIVNALMQVGFRRFGIAESFIHVDNDPDKNPSIWLY